MSGMSRFKELLEPLQIGEVTLKNRMVMPPMTTNFASKDGYVTQQTMDYYEEHAKGGIGLITVEAACVDYPAGQIAINQLAINDDRFLPGLSELVQVIHKHGAKASIQLHHGGPLASYALTRIQPVGPSPITVVDGVVVRELRPNEIAEIITCYAEAAQRAKKAGFDAVQIQFAGGFLLGSFLSRVTNKRRDGYGGQLENRARIHLEVIKAVKQAVGQGYPVLCRINGKEYGEEYGIDGCLTLEEAQRFARMVQDAGISAISVVTWGWIQTPSGLALDLFKAYPDERGALVPFAQKIKEAVSVPVITVGKLDTECARELLQENRADLVSFGRELLADPQLPNKVASGAVEDITPCIFCNVCLEGVTTNQPIRCPVNAALGREREYTIKRAQKEKKIVIVGGGPAGMEAARVTALRGHEVVLYEKHHELGGQLLTAVLPPHKNRIRGLTDYLIIQLRKLGVKLELGTEVTPRQVQEARPDVIIIATGVNALIPKLPGIERDNVVIAEDILVGKAQVKDKVAVIGGGVVGCETAEFLADKDKKVTVIEILPVVASKMPFARREQLLDRLVRKGVTLLSNVKCEGLTEKGDVIISKQGKEETIEADTVVLAAGAEPNRYLFEQLEGVFPEIYLAGDCVEPRDILAAIHDGSRTARLI
jgi:2,4-dienoyl-CoA reductase-like NADH-dependent reductase (Old Yellow Enzyme family)/thioredoxin reductase